MQNAEWILRGFIECLGVRERLDRLYVHEHVQFRKLQNSHWSLNEYLRNHREILILFTGMHPYVTTSGCQHRKCAFDIVLRRHKESLAQCVRGLLYSLKMNRSDMPCS